MAIKHVSRSLAEGAGPAAKQGERRYSSSSLRARETALAATLLTDPDDDAVVFPVPRRTGRWFSGKVGPSKRWLGRNAGLAVPLRGVATESVVEWLAGRRVGCRGAMHYWFTPTPVGLFRQERPLDDAEVERWLALPEWLRRQHAVFRSAP